MSFTIGKRRPKPTLTDEQRGAIQQIKDYCTQAGITRDQLAQMFGIANWITFENLRAKGRRAEQIAAHLQQIKRFALTHEFKKR